MGKREFTNRMSLRGAYLYATWQSQQNKIIGRDPHVGFSILLRMTIRMISRDPHVSPLDFLRMIILKIGRPLELFALQKIGVTVCYILISSMSMTGTVSAVCVATPNCAEIGYTATSCEGDYLKCPFDTSKMKCIPCDTSFQYACNGEGQVGQGESCDGKYIECGCTNGYEWDDVNKICTSSCSDTSCRVGNIMYSDGTCCKEKLDNKTAIGVVVKDNELVMSKEIFSSFWSENNGGTDISSLNNYTSETVAITDFNGRVNTLAIVAACANDTTEDNAAIYCNSYSTEGTNVGQWYLPAAGELYSYVSANKNTLEAVCRGSVNLGCRLFDEPLWASAEYNEYRAWNVCAYDNSVGKSSKGAFSSACCFLPINVNNGVAEPCSSEYKYTCSGTGYSGGSGTACGGMYASCTCTSGYEWKNGVCSKKPDCNVGYIYYADKTCSSSYNSSKTVAGIVVKKNKLVMSKPIRMTWSSDYDNVSGLTDITSSSTAQADMNGKSNTSTIVSYHTGIGESTSTSAALYCNSYTGGISGTSGKWYLPAAGELYSYVYGNYSTLNPVATTLSWSYFVNWFWSSSERSGDNAWFVYSSDGSVTSSSKDYYTSSVSCLLDIS